MTEGYSARFTGKERSYICAPHANAYRAIGTVEPGFRMELVNRGQFSLIDVIRVLIEQTGPAYLTVSTWTIGRAEVAAIAWLLDGGYLLDLRVIMMNRTFKTMHRQWSRHGEKGDHYRALERTFGAERIVQCQSHAKFVLIVNEQWSIAVRTSANFNSNARLEQFSIDDDRAMAEFYASIVQSWAKTVAPGFGPPAADIDRAFKRLDAFSDVRSLPPAVDGEFDLDDLLLDDLDLEGLL